MFLFRKLTMFVNSYLFCSGFRTYSVPRLRPPGLPRRHQTTRAGSIVHFPHPGRNQGGLRTGNRLEAEDADSGAAPTAGTGRADRGLEELHFHPDSVPEELLQRI